MMIQHKRCMERINEVKDFFLRENFIPLYFNPEEIIGVAFYEELEEDDERVGDKTSRVESLLELLK